MSDIRPSLLGSLKLRLAGKKLFLLTVVLPTALGSLYYGLIASDVYISESSFVVRSPQRQSARGLGAFLQGVGFARSHEDSYIVQDYMLSRDALRLLDRDLRLAGSFGSGSVDLLSRFAGLDGKRDFESLHRYYRKKISVNLDPSSEITNLRVKAFTAEDAYRINEQLLEMSEGLVNRLNERAWRDTVRFAEDEVGKAESRARGATLAVSHYRNREGVFDPDRQSALQLQQVSKMQDELIASRVQLAQLSSVAKDNPQIPTLTKRIETLQSEICAESVKVAGSRDSLSDKAAGYERPALEREFADKQLAAALASLEQARSDAESKQLYLERIAQPSRPDVAVEPRRLRAVITTLLLGLVAWGVLGMLNAGVREHKE